MNSWNPEFTSAFTILIKTKQQEKPPHEFQLRFEQVKKFSMSGP